MPSWYDRFIGPPPTVARPLVWFEDTFSASLPSAIDGGHFHGTFAARWLGAPGAATVNREWLRRSAMQSAESATRNFSATHLDNAQLSANTQLQTMRVPADWGAQGFSVSVTLAATAEAQRLAAEWENVRGQLAVQRLTERLELERLRHLREDIFTRPEVARTYWLEKHPEALEAVCDAKFERLAETLGSGPGPSTMVIANIVQELLAGLDSGDKKTLVEMLNHLLIAFRRGELAAKLPPDMD